MAPSVRRAGLPSLLADDGEDKFEQDLVVCEFFALPSRRPVVDLVPLVFEDGFPADDKLPELPDSLPFSAGTRARHTPSQYQLGPITGAGLIMYLTF